MNIKEQIKDFRSTLEVIVAVIGCMVYLNTFIDDRIVSKDEFLLATTEIRLGQVKSDLREFQRIGVDNMTEAEKHQYELLKKAEDKLISTRNKYIGLDE